jgi:hypothetical protein
MTPHPKPEGVAEQVREMCKTACHKVMQEFGGEPGLALRCYDAIANLDLSPLSAGEKDDPNKCSCGRVRAVPDGEWCPVHGTTV